MKTAKRLCILLCTLFLSFLFVCCAFAEEYIPESESDSPQIIEENGQYFYYNENGEMVTKQFVTIGKKTYYFGKDGVMLQGELFTKGNKTYYANENGLIAKNRFVNIGRKRYFFDSKGVRKIGWINHGGHTYYCTSTGKAYRNQWKKIGSYYYYFTSDYYIRKGKWVDGYYVDKQGHRVIAPPAQSGTKTVIKMNNIRQNPELPTGCESVALTMVLKHYGFDLSKTTIASSYMPRSGSNFVTAFWGNPFSSDGGGIYAPGLTTTANRYLQAKKSPLKAYNISGAEFGTLTKYIDKGIPVIVWNTMYMRSPVPVASMSCLGRNWTFYQSEHCVVLCGYDLARKQVLINDPLSGLVWRSTSAFKSYYNTLGKMAVIIK